MVKESQMRYGKKRYGRVRHSRTIRKGRGKRIRKYGVSRGGIRL